MKQWEISKDLADPPNMKEVGEAIQPLQTGKAAGDDALPAKVFIQDDAVLMDKIHDFLLCIRKSEEILDQFKDGVIITMFKHKGDSHDWDNHHNISLVICLKNSY